MAVRREATIDAGADPARGSTGRLLIGLVREMRTSFERGLTPLGITAQQAELLHRTHLEGEVSARQLTHLLMTDKAGVTRLVDRLVAKGLIARRTRPEDRRSVRITLTPAGRALVPKVARIATWHKRRLFGGLTSAEEERLRQFLLRVLAAARKLNA